jgi:hypothetical protein
MAKPIAVDTLSPADRLLRLMSDPMCDSDATTEAARAALEAARFLLRAAEIAPEDPHRDRAVALHAALAAARAAVVAAQFALVETENRGRIIQ